MNLQLRLLLSIPVAALALSGCATPPVIDDSTSKPLTALSTPELPLPADAKRINGIAVQVNDDIITFREVLRESQFAIQDAEKKGALGDNARRDIRLATRKRMIEKLLTEQKTRELGIKIGDDEIRQAIEDVKRQNNNMTQSQLETALKGQGFSMPQYEQQIREQLERLRLVSMEVRSKVNVTDKDAEEYYQKNLGMFAEEEVFKARHIFIRVDEKAAPELTQQAMAKALNVLHEAREGADFSALARKYSEDPAASKDGGSLGSFKRGEMLAELENAILPLKSGEVGELVVTPSGLHIVKLDERISGKPKPFDTVKADIRETLYRKQQDERFNAWLNELRAKATIIIKDGSGIL